ncbi:MAG: hypothetical protein LBF86_07820 [Helicobacteraceae bacterium]|nr:hypothetical protein [Helicobacteraceae bacterium]
MIAASTGSYHSFALSKDGKVYATGASVGDKFDGDSGSIPYRKTLTEVSVASD